MKNKLRFTLGIISLTLATVQGQNYIGHRIDNYSGIHGVMYNPASVFDSRMRTDVNLISFGISAGNDYAGLNLTELGSGEEGFDFESQAEQSPSEANNFYINTDVMGPSFMFNLNAKSSIGLITRVRGLFNINNINGELYQNITNDFDTDENFDFNIENLSGTAHVFAEIGVAYGRQLLYKDQHFLKAGVTLKYLNGAGSLFVHSPNLNGSYNATQETLTATGTFNYGTTVDFDNEAISFESMASGFGADLGFIYEFRPDTTGIALRSKNKYKLKLGASLTDLGSLSYDNSTINTYNVTGTVDAQDFEDEDVETVLDENYPSVETLETVKLNLPTALHLMADYHLKNKFYINLQSSLSLVSKDKERANRITNTLTLAPRLETKWFSVYSPISVQQYDGFAWGFGLRAGPLTVGSASAITNLISSNSKAADVYFGLKIPIYQ
ncbi:hypothetical protein DSM03_101342 [Leeuwenhoekiella aestuarii]|uniref:DUF5723 domain-containing protein n=1 Tax=Leeuwenhoekiella aestuarii TaxID=2249426 RepID=A0A4Q0NSV2_9FLAO|nr:DUF5723 family protein [Leeuwenhoekiella aestuarii]RXG14225.1 hypothetical protein DSM04_104333 [Leeuwenhoekiella aestuarii]RXG18974.1 hypothetical protein DSM03_101342 [Leeuwenhoekiella aestuarii]